MLKYLFQPLNIVFAAATTLKEIIFDAERIEYISGDLDIIIRLDSPSADPVTLQEGEGVEGAFTRFYLDTSGAGSVTLLISKPVGFRKVSAKAKIDEILKVEKTSLATFGAVSIDNTVGGILIADSDADRKTLTISPIGGTIYVGEAGVTVNDGMPVVAGGSLNLDRFTGAVYGISAGAAVDTRYIIEGV